MTDRLTAGISPVAFHGNFYPFRGTGSESCRLPFSVPARQGSAHGSIEEHSPVLERLQAESGQDEHRAENANQTPKRTSKVQPAAAPCTAPRNRANGMVARGMDGFELLERPLAACQPELQAEGHSEAWTDDKAVAESQGQRVAEAEGRTVRGDRRDDAQGSLFSAQAGRRLSARRPGYGMSLGRRLVSSQ